LECRVAMQILQNCFRPWDALQVFGWSDSNLQNALHDGRLGGDGGRFGAPRS